MKFLIMMLSCGLILLSLGCSNKTNGSMPKEIKPISPTSTYMPTRIEYLVLNLNVSLIQLVDVHKPSCFALDSRQVQCIGFLGNQKRDRVIKQLIRETFDQLASKLEIQGQVSLYVPE